MGRRKGTSGTDGTPFERLGDRDAQALMLIVQCRARVLGLGGSALRSSWWRCMSRRPSSWPRLLIVRTAQAQALIPMIKVGCQVLDHVQRALAWADPALMVSGERQAHALALIPMIMGGRRVLVRVLP